MQITPRRQLEIAERAEIALERRQQAGHADRRMCTVVERQQQQFQMRGAAVLRCRGDAGDGRQHFLGDIADDVLDLAAALGRKQCGEAEVFQIAAEQGADAGAGDAKRIARLIVVRQHEDIAEQLANRARLDLAAVRCPRVPAFCVPIGEKFPARWMFHSGASPCSWLDGTHLSRFCARAFPGLLCRTGFAASMPRARFGRFRGGFALLTLN